MTSKQGNEVRIEARVTDLQRKKAILRQEVDVCIHVAILMVTGEHAVGVGDRVPNRGKFNSSAKFI